MSFKHTYQILADREAARLDFAYPAHYPTPQHVFYSTARSQKHRGSNRYSNIWAYDRTAILAPSSGYLNANIVTDGRQWWVASQAPTPRTFASWFQAIYEKSASKHPLLSKAKLPENSKGKRPILVQLTGWEERGIIKADRYLLPATFGELAVKVVGEGEWREDIKTRVTNLTVNEMDVRHYHFEAWPDHGVPAREDLKALRRLIYEVEEVRDGEVWVHCSAGVGRTGAFISLSSLLLESKGGDIPLDPSPLGPLPPDIASDRVASTVDQLREWRGMLVQGPEQMKMIYDMVESR